MKPSRNFWTADEVDELILMAAEGKTNAQIAKKLGRTMSAIAHKRSALHLTAEKLMAEKQAAEEEAEKADSPEARLAAIEESLVQIRTELLELRQLEGENRRAIRNAYKDIYIIDDYLDHSRLWRLFHSYSSFKVRRLKEMEKLAK